MPSFLTALVFFHVLGNLVWIGSLLAVGLAMSAPGIAATERGLLARRLYLRLAVPGFLLAFATGLARLVMDVELFLVRTHYMHAKLTFALVIIALHHVLGARARRLAGGQEVPPAATNALTLVVLLCAAAATYLVLTKAF
jgi:putative membrane protein